jgi:hypothetical protein
MVLVVIALAVLCMVSSTPVHADQHQDAVVPGFARFKAVEPVNRHAIQRSTTTVPAQTKWSHRFEVRDGDCKGKDDCKAGRERAEITTFSKDFSKPFWIAFRLYIPEDFPDVWPAKASFFNVQQTGLPGATSDKPKLDSPVLTLEVENGKLFLRWVRLVRTDFALRTEEVPIPFGELADLKGRWTHFAFWMDLGLTSGALSAWRDNTLFAELKDPLLSEPPQTVVIRIGLNRRFVSRYRNVMAKPTPTQVAYVADVRAGGELPTLQALLKPTQ